MWPLATERRETKVTVFQSKTLSKLDQFALDVIRNKVQRVCRRSGALRSEAEDLEQELFLKLRAAVPDADHRKGSVHGLIVRTVDNFLKNFLRDRFAQKRDPRRTVSLQDRTAPVYQHPAERDAHRGKRSAEDQFGRTKTRDQWDLRIDLHTLLEALSENNRDIAERLQFVSKKESAEQLGMPRTTFNDQVRKLRRPFEDAGLQDYLPNSPSH